MKRKQWSDKEKFEIILSGLRGTLSVAEICATHEINQSQYYKWREQFYRQGAKVFASNQNKPRERVLEKKIEKMQQVIGELTLELKKSD